MKKQDRIKKTIELLGNDVWAWSTIKNCRGDIKGTIHYYSDRVPFQLKDIVDDIVVIEELYSDCKTPNGRLHYAMWNDHLKYFVPYGDQNYKNYTDCGWILSIGKPMYYFDPHF